MATRQVTGTIHTPNGDPWPDYRVAFRVHPSTFTLSATYPIASAEVVTEPDGTFAVTLETGIQYEVHLAPVVTPPTVQRIEAFRIVVPDGEGPISLESVRAAGMQPPAPSVVDAVTAIIGDTVQDAAATAVPGLVPGEVANTLANTPTLAPEIAAQVALQPVVTDAAAQALMALMGGIDGGSPEATYGAIVAEGGTP